ncbi:MAG: thiamine pyrophosphate-dependent enzyme [Pseudomonadota bacterium]
MQMYLSGSEALAQAVRLCRVEVMSSYPITPNTPSLLALNDLIKNGEMDTTAVNAESELGSMLICAGAAAVGVRTFNCTAAQGLALMKEPLWMASGMALPVVLAVTSRQLGSPQGLLSDFSDCFSERDASILQFMCENHQEIVDSLIMAYRVSEHPKVLLPAFVVLEGFRLSHSYELVEIPEKEAVDRFLPKYEPRHAFVDSSYPITQGAGAFSQYYGLKFQQYRAMLDARGVILDTYGQFSQILGRSYPGLIETYKTEDADVVFVAMGTLVSVLRELVDEYREKGIKIGLLKIRVFRPFPEKEILDALGGSSHVVVIDRAVTPGRRGGISHVEVAASLSTNMPRMLSNYIVGGKDMEKKDVIDIIQESLSARDPFIKWHGELFEETASELSGYSNYIALAERGEKRVSPLKEGERLMAQGSTTCPACLSLTSIRQCLEEFDSNTVVTTNSGCLTVASAFFPITTFRVPELYFTFSNAGAAASGMEVALKRLGKDMKVFLFGGDGGLFDIGLQTFSAALERGHEIVYVCYDNEAYMNTGVQRSGSTPWLTKTKTTPLGKQERKKNLMKIVMAHDNVYAATASPAYPQDLKKKVRKAKKAGKPAFIHILCPCPTGWEYSDEKGIEIARLAFETNFFPLYEYDEGRIKVRKPKKKKKVNTYLKMQGRFSHLTDRQIEDIQKYVDMEFEKLIRLESLGADT